MVGVTMSVPVLNNLNKFVQDVKGGGLDDPVLGELARVYDRVAAEVARGCTFDQLAKEMNDAAAAAGVQRTITRGSVFNLKNREGGKKNLPVLRAWMARPAASGFLDEALARRAYDLLGQALGVAPRVTLSEEETDVAHTAGAPGKKDAPRKGAPAQIARGGRKK